MNTSTVEGKVYATFPGGFGIVLADGSHRRIMMPEGRPSPVGIGATVDVTSLVRVVRTADGYRERYTAFSIRKIEAVY